MYWSSNIKFNISAKFMILQGESLQLAKIVMVPLAISPLFSNLIFSIMLLFKLSKPLMMVLTYNLDWHLGKNFITLFTWTGENIINFSTFAILKGLDLGKMFTMWKWHYFAKYQTNDIFADYILLNIYSCYLSVCKNDTIRFVSKQFFQSLLLEIYM